MSEHEIDALKKRIAELEKMERGVQEAHEYAASIISTVREPLIVLDGDLKVISAGCSFYETFKVKPGETEGQFIYDLGDRQWDNGTHTRDYDRIGI